MTNYYRTITLILFALCALATPTQAAHFDIDSGRVVLRQLQYCTHCGSALLVTNIHPGSNIRCPDCGYEQPRIENKYTLNQMYQLCKTCQGPLNPEGHKPGDNTECENCHTRQALNRDAFALAKTKNGPGYAPGHPPGNAKKTLLLAPQKADALLSMIPMDQFDHSSTDLPLPTNFATKKIPQPPQEFQNAKNDDNTKTLVITEQIHKKPPQTIKEEQPQKQKPPTQKPENPLIAAPLPPTNPTPPIQAKSDAIDVPAVTADLFGGKRLAPAARDTSTYTPPGKILARVNGEPIHQRDVDRVVEPVMERLRSRATKDELALVEAREQELRNEVVARLIDRELVVREAAAMGYVPDPAAVRNRENELAQIMTAPGVNLRREAVRDITMTDIRKRFDKPGSATPTAIREFYQQHKDQLIQPRRIAIDQLVVYEDRTDRTDKRDYRDIAADIAAAFEQGQRFDEVRDKYDEFAKAAGIEHAPPQLLPEAAYSRQILAAAGELRRGAVFGPLMLSGMALYGKVTDERKEGPTPFEEVERDIRRKLEEEATEKALADWLKRLRANARIEIAK